MEPHHRIQANASRLRDLHDSLRATEPTQEERIAAITHYSERYDQLAFPGGLSRGMMLLAAGDLNAIGAAVDFLESDPHFHRSGYIKADILRYLKRADLDERQRDRLRRVVLDRVRGPDTREFRRYCRIATVLDSGWFRRSLMDQLENPDPVTKRHAEWVLIALEHA
jgi:hypothetical protein